MQGEVVFHLNCPLTCDVRARREHWQPPTSLTRGCRARSLLHQLREGAAVREQRNGCYAVRCLRTVLVSDAHSGSRVVRIQLGPLRNSEDRRSHDSVQVVSAQAHRVLFLHVRNKNKADGFAPKPAAS